MILLILRILALTVASIVIIFPNIARALEPEPLDPRYQDLWGHWASDYVFTMWQEGTLDGDVYSWSSYFYPNRAITRAEFAVMAAKTFRLAPNSLAFSTFADVPPSYRLFGKKTAQPYIEAAAAKGIIRGTGDGYFSPNVPLTREEAVTVMVRALGLEGYAQSLPESEVNRFLRWFYDSGRTSPYARPYLSAAISLGLIQGYGDGTVRPLSLLTRAEAATILFRSCLVNAIPEPNPFSPDSDGFEDTTVFSINTLKNRAITSWNMTISDRPNAIPLMSFNSGNQAAPPPQIAWDGRAPNGFLFPYGTYFYRIRVWDLRGNVFSSPLLPITLEKKTLSAQVVPGQAAPGETVRLKAVTVATALSVSAAGPFGETIDLRPEAPAYAADLLAPRPWGSGYRVPANAPDGTFRVSFLANYRGATRRVSVPLTVRLPLKLSGKISPNPAASGQAITIEAQGSPELESVSAKLPWMTAGLTRRDLTRWTADVPVPITAAPGKYDVTLIGRSGTRTVESRLTLEVKGNPLNSIRFILTD